MKKINKTDVLTPENNENTNTPEENSDNKTQSQTEPAKSSIEELQDAINTFKDVFSDFKKQISPIFQEFRSDIGKIFSELAQATNTENENNIPENEDIKDIINEVPNTDDETSDKVAKSSDELHEIFDAIKTGIKNATERVHTGDFQFVDLVKNELRNYVYMNEHDYSINVDENGENTIDIDRKFLEDGGVKTIAAVLNNSIIAGIKSFITNAIPKDENTETSPEDDLQLPNLKVNFKLADILTSLYEKNPIENTPENDNNDTEESREALLKATLDLDDILNGKKEKQNTERINEIPVDNTDSVE